MELEGKIASVTGQLLAAPVSGKACVLYRFRVEEQVASGSGKNRRTRWVSRIDEKRQVGFVLHDGTGGVEVDFAKGEPAPRRRRGRPERLPERRQPEFERALRERGQSSTGLLLNRTLRWSEMYLEIGDPLYALGAPDDGRRVTKGSDGVLVVSDQGQTALLQRIAGEAAMLRRVATLGFVVAGAIGALLLRPALRPVAVHAPGGAGLAQQGLGAGRVARASRSGRRGPRGWRGRGGARAPARGGPRPQP